MNPQETQQVIARDEKWVPSTERVKIIPTNVRLETTVHQKEETFQVIIDVIKNSTCFKAFTIFAKVPKILMHQFWYTVKKVKDTKSYEFILANKRCVVDAEVFRNILDICPRVEGEEFTEVQDDDATFTFLIDLGYKGPLQKHPNMYVDHMHQPWRTLAAIINKCLYGKTTSSDRLRKSRIDIMWGMFYRENIPPKKSRGKGSQGKKTADTTEATVDVYEELDPEPLGKFMSLTDTAKKEAARQVYATHARIVTELVPEPARRRPSEQIATDTIKELKESKKTSRRQPGTRGSSEGTGVSPGVPDKSTVILATSSEGTGTKPRVPDEEKVTSEANAILVWGSEQESEYSKEDNDDETIEWVDTDEEEEKKDDDDDKSIDLEQTDN
ncbi:hypothetical protein Tco_0017759 [Tanacetum coccineum]